MKEIAPHIGFEDAIFKSCEISNNTLIVYLESWDNKTIKLIFFNTIQLVNKTHSYISGAYEKMEQTDFF